jgi:hypothetical protein
MNEVVEVLIQLEKESESELTQEDDYASIFGLLLMNGPCGDP